MTFDLFIFVLLIVAIIVLIQNARYQHIISELTEEEYKELEKKVKEYLDY